MTDLHTAHVKIINPKGLHARASAKLAALANSLPARITLSHEGEQADARSIMDLLCLGAAYSSTGLVEVRGEEAEQILEAVRHLFQQGFGELDDSQQPD